MLITAQFYYGLIGIIILLSAILVGIVISYFAMLKRLSSYEKRENEIIETAQKEAEDIITQAKHIHKASEKTLSEAADELEQHEEQELAQISEDSIRSIEEKIEQINANNVAALSANSEDIKKSLNLHFEELRDLLGQQTVAAQNQAEAKVKEEYDAMEAELAVYKKSQIEKIDQNIYQILINVSKDVLGKKIDPKENEEVIIKALEEAEKQMN